MKISLASPGSPPSGDTATGGTKSFGTLALLLAALIALAAFVFAAPYVPRALQGTDIFSQLANNLSGNTTTTASSTSTSTASPACVSVSTDHTPAAPDIRNGSASIAYPTDYCAIVSYILTVINQDRATNGSAPVEVGYNKAAQQHSDSMLYYSYFSHFDTQGYKPYMRYSLLGGVGADFENVAYLKYSAPHFTSTGSVEAAINTLEESMMYNDSLCCNNGHRDNILSPLHNVVSIGVAYNSTTVYFDEEFENDYMTLTFSSTGASSSTPYYVTMSGAAFQTAPTPDAIYIAYDGPPSAETPATLNAGPHEYGPGTLTGGVLPRTGFPPQCGQFQSGITVCADSWVFSSTQVSIKFSLQEFVKSYGAGVYTVYLVTGSSTISAITTISVFVS